MKIAGVASHERVSPRYHDGTECLLFVSLQCLLQRADERRLTGTPGAREYVQQSDRLIAKNQDISEAS
jgi:hypothetical protein